MDGRTHTRRDNVKTVYPPQTKFAGGIRTHTRTDNVKTVYPTQTKFAGGIINEMATLKAAYSVTLKNFRKKIFSF